MERVGILINKLQEQLTQKAEVKNMLVTVQMLQAELMQVTREHISSTATGVNIMVPFNTVIPEPPATNGSDKKAEEPAKPAMPVEEPVKTPLPPREPVAQNSPPAEEKSATFTRSEPEGWSLKAVDVPTLSQQDKASGEINDSIPKDGGSLNESLKDNRFEVANVLKEVPIKDLKKAISINDRHLFIHELFRDDETMYERSIKTINSFYIFAEAEYWIQREPKLKLGWDMKSETVKLFDQLVKRRFS